MTGFSTGGQGQDTLESKIGKGAQMQLNQSISAASNGEQNMSGATNQDLNKRLAEMKAKLQAIKRK